MEMDRSTVEEGVPSAADCLIDITRIRTFRRCGSERETDLKDY